jgi:hypothetical protein
METWEDISVQQQESPRVAAASGQPDQLDYYLSKKIALNIFLRNRKSHLTGPT